MSYISSIIPAFFPIIPQTVSHARLLRLFPGPCNVNPRSRLIAPEQAEQIAERRAVRRNMRRGIASSQRVS